MVPGEPIYQKYSRYFWTPLDKLVPHVLCQHVAEDPILDLAIDYVRNGRYPDGIDKNKKRSVRKRATNLVLECGEIFFAQKEQEGQFSKLTCTTALLSCS